jgi:hypothetical protein
MVLWRRRPGVTLAVAAGNDRPWLDWKLASRSGSFRHAS